MKHILLFCCCALSYLAEAQTFQYQGSAAQIDDQCYLLTPANANRSGTMWSQTTIDLSQSFEFTVAMNFGCTDANGADGIGFCFHQQGAELVPPSGGVFFQGITPSFAVELDTYENPEFNDPAFDHIMISKNGEIDQTITANILAAPVQASPTSANIEDCVPHLVTMKWDATTKKFEVFFDCLPRISYTGDIVNTIFGGNPNVTWGYKGSTGLYFNEQSICLIESTFFSDFNKTVCKNIDVSITAPPALSTVWSTSSGTITPSPTNPRKVVFNSAIVGTYMVTATQVNYCNEPSTYTYNVVVEPCCSAIAINSATNTSCTASCDGTATTNITTSPIGTSEQFLWSNTATTSTITGLCAGIYTVTVTDGNSCTQSYSLTVAAQTTPTLNLGADATYCDGATVMLDALISSVTYAWSNGATTQTFITSGAGTYTVSVTIPGCPAPLIDDITLTFIPAPILELGADQTVCYGTTVALDAGNSGGIFSYLWQNGFIEQVLSTSAIGKNEYKVKVFKDKCIIRDSLFVEILPQIIPLSQNSQIFCKENDITLNLVANTGFTAYAWSTGANTQTTLLTPPLAGNYTVTATNSNNCTGTGVLTLVDECEPEIHVPTAFTPNGDGLNDVLQVFGINVKTIEINIFNRWGQVVFSTKTTDGLPICTACFWDGKHNGAEALAGTYTYNIKYTGETNAGTKNKIANGNVLLIR